MARVCEPKTGLFPEPRELSFQCSCPDWASMCKHVAAVLYGVGARLDERPELLFLLRGVEQQDLIAKADAGLRTPAKAGKAARAGKVLDSSDLSQIFGIEMAETPGHAAAPRRGKATSKTPRPLKTAKRMTITMYGIKNCDTIKKARAWLDARGLAYDFHDYKTAGVDRDRLERWCREFGWEAVCNRAGTTFRKLPEAEKQGLDARRAVALMVKQPSLIKRPILDVGGRWYLGFTPESYARAVGGKA